FHFEDEVRVVLFGAEEGVRRFWHGGADDDAVFDGVLRLAAPLHPAVEIFPVEEIDPLARFVGGGEEGNREEAEKQFFHGRGAGWRSFFEKSGNDRVAAYHEADGMTSDSEDGMPVARGPPTGKKFRGGKVLEA